MLGDGRAITGPPAFSQASVLGKSGSIYFPPRTSPSRMVLGAHDSLNRSRFRITPVGICLFAPSLRRSWVCPKNLVALGILSSVEKGGRFPVSGVLWGPALRLKEGHPHGTCGSPVGSTVFPSGMLFQWADDSFCTLPCSSQSKVDRIMKFY